jgi:hypothetical protein
MDGEGRVSESLAKSSLVGGFRHDRIFSREGAKVPSSEGMKFPFEDD